MSKRLLFISFICAVGLLTSCSVVDSCQQDLSNIGLNVSMYKMIYDADSETYGTQMYQGAVSVSGVGVDSLLYDSAVVSKFTLPLKMHDSISDFLVRIYHRVNDSTVLDYLDTLTIEHSNEQKLVSLECGCVFDFKIENVGLTVHGLDSAVVVNPTVTYKAKDNNVNLYLKGR